MVKTFGLVGGFSGSKLSFPPKKIIYFLLFKKFKIQTFKKARQALSVSHLSCGRYIFFWSFFYKNKKTQQLSSRQAAKTVPTAKVQSNKQYSFFQNVD